MLLFDPPAIAPIQRVRCRQIADTDFTVLADLLTRGFPRSHRDYWIRGFSRWQRLPVVEGVPRFGYVLEAEIGLVGAILLISSARGGRVISNLSSWYVEPAWRVHSSLLVTVATRQRHVVYLNAAPAPHTWRMLQTQGFKLYNSGRSTVFCWPGRGAVSSAIRDDLPEARLLHDHREMGAVCVTVEKDGLIAPFVFKPQRLERPPVKMMELIYCRGQADFKRCAPALARHFLKSGVAGFLVDGKVEGLPSSYVRGREPRYYKGLQPPALNDLAYTEKTLFG